MASNSAVEVVLIAPDVPGQANLLLVSSSAIKPMMHDVILGLNIIV